jgi:hypothetical protein
MFAAQSEAYKSSRRGTLILEETPETAKEDITEEGQEDKAHNIFDYINVEPVESERSNTLFDKKESERSNTLFDKKGEDLESERNIDKASNQETRREEIIGYDINYF